MCVFLYLQWHINRKYFQLIENNWYIIENFISVYLCNTGKMHCTFVNLEFLKIFIQDYSYYIFLCIY